MSQGVCKMTKLFMQIIHDEEIIMSVYTVWKNHKEINALLLNTWIESDTYDL